MSNINKKRAAKMQQRSDSELRKIMESGSLSAAAATYELRKRGAIAK
jgi:hypothetical protein